jgi:cyanate permease
MVMVVASIGSLGMIALAPSPAWAYLYGLLVGIGYSVTAPLMPSGPWVAGRIFDVTGGYRLALLLALVAALAAVGALWAAAPRRGAAAGA